MTETRNNRMVLLLIAGIPLTMILAATWLWYFVAKGDLDLVGVLGTANQGTLLQPPRQVDDVAMFEAGMPSPIAELEPRWTLLVPAAGERCDEACENRLYVTRQIHVAIGKDFNRMRRIYVSDRPAGEVRLDVPQLSDGRPAPQVLTDYFDSEHRGMEVRSLSASDFQRLFPELATDPSTWYLVDPRGWIMMSYNKDIHYKDVISDLKFLLKNSSD